MARRATILAVALLAIELTAAGAAQAQSFLAVPRTEFPMPPSIKAPPIHLDPLIKQPNYLPRMVPDPLVRQQMNFSLVLGWDSLLKKEPPPKSAVEHPPLSGYRPRTQYNPAPVGLRASAYQSRQPRPSRRQPLGW